MKNFVFLFILMGFWSCKKTSLKDRINQVVKDKKAKVGVAIIDMSNSQLTQINGNDDFPLQSVFKFHIAAKVLDELDKGKFNLSDKIEIKETEILENTYSPLRNELGKRGQSIRLDSLLYYMVALSDNNACDILLSRIGGPVEVNDYFKSLGFTGVKITVNEEQMHQDWETQFSNVVTPIAAAETIKRFYLREYLSGDAHNFLYGLMTITPTGKKRIKAGSPKNATVAHKTGTSGRNDLGISAATNDIGVVTLPGGKAFIVAIFVTDSKETDDTNEKIIAEITQCIFAN